MIGNLDMGLDICNDQCESYVVFHLLMVNDYITGNSLEDGSLFTLNN